MEGFKLTYATDGRVQASFFWFRCFDRSKLVRRQHHRDNLCCCIKHAFFFGGCYASGEQGAVGTFGTNAKVRKDTSGVMKIYGKCARLHCGSGEANINRVVVTSSVAAVGPPMTYLEAGFGKRCYERAIRSHVAPQSSRIHHG